MQQLKQTFGFWENPPTTGTGDDGFFQGAGNPSPEEKETRTLPTQGNEFPHQTSPHTDDEAVKLAVGDPL